jgi:hypothetical protein
MYITPHLCLCSGCVCAVVWMQPLLEMIRFANVHKIRSITSKLCWHSNSKCGGTLYPLHISYSNRESRVPKEGCIICRSACQRSTCYPSKVAIIYSQLAKKLNNLANYCGCKFSVLCKIIF